MSDKLTINPITWETWKPSDPGLKCVYCHETASHTIEDPPYHFAVACPTCTNLYEALREAGADALETKGWVRDLGERRKPYSWEKEV